METPTRLNPPEHNRSGHQGYRRIRSGRCGWTLNWIDRNKAERKRYRKDDLCDPFCPTLRAVARSFVAINLEGRLPPALGGLAGSTASAHPAILGVALIRRQVGTHPVRKAAGNGGGGTLDVVARGTKALRVAFEAAALATLQIRAGAVAQTAGRRAGRAVLGLAGASGIAGASTGIAAGSGLQLPTGTIRQAASHLKREARRPVAEGARWFGPPAVAPAFQEPHVRAGAITKATSGQHSDARNVLTRSPRRERPTSFEKAVQCLGLRA